MKAKWTGAPLITIEDGDLFWWTSGELTLWSVDDVNNKSNLMRLPLFWEVITMPVWLELADTEGLNPSA